MLFLWEILPDLPTELPDTLLRTADCLGHFNAAGEFFPQFGRRINYCRADVLFSTLEFFPFWRDLHGEGHSGTGQENSQFISIPIQLIRRTCEIDPEFGNIIDRNPAAVHTV